MAPVDPADRLPGHTALLSFGIRAQSLEAQQALIERVRGRSARPVLRAGRRRGSRCELAGLPVIAAAAASDLSSSRYWLTLAGAGRVALVLLAVYRSVSRALVPLVPVVLASGWSALVLWASGIPLNPMSAALGALTVAIATEFSVILSARFHEERGRGGRSPRPCSVAYSRTGAAVLASGLTATAGFAVLIASDVRMLRDFGVVTVIDLAVALVGVMVALPAALRLGRGAMRDRYSIAVGLLFAAVVVIAIIHQSGQGHRAPSASKNFPALAAAGVRGSASARLAGRGRQRRPG